MKWIEDRNGGMWNLSTMKSIKISYFGIYVWFGENEIPILQFNQRDWDEDPIINQEGIRYNDSLSLEIRFVGAAIAAFIKNKEPDNNLFSIPEVLAIRKKNKEEEKMKVGRL